MMQEEISRQKIETNGCRSDRDRENRDRQIKGREKERERERTYKNMNENVVKRTKWPKIMKYKFPEIQQ